MRLGCIAIGEIRCDGCNRLIKHPERYLAIYDEEGVESEQGKTLRYCVDCCLGRGYAHYRMEKGEQILTFFPE
jgi:sulfur relay (sulfurtransferase) complex TusBCD TusD component (DsrE family)